MKNMMTRMKNPRVKKKERKTREYWWRRGTAGGTDGTPEDDALKISKDDLPSNEDADTATPLPEEVMEALTQEVTGEEEEDVADEQENISKD